MSKNQLRSLFLLVVICLLGVKSIKAQWSGTSTEFITSGNVGIGITVPIAQLHVVGTSVFEGNVGIGTTNPTSKLEVNGNTKIVGDLSDLTFFKSDGLTQLGRLYDDNGFVLEGRVNQNLILRTKANNTGEGIRFQNSSSSDLVFIDGISGNVGIGTTTPRSRLDLGLNVGAGNGLRVGSYLVLNERETINNAAFIGFNTLIDQNDVNLFKPDWAGATYASGMIMTMDAGGKGNIDFHGIDWGTNPAGRPLSDFTHVMRLSTGGNVGIGITAPSAALHIKNDRAIRIEAAQGPGWIGEIKMVDAYVNDVNRDDMLFSVPGGFMFKIDNNKNGVSSIRGFQIFNRDDEALFTVKESDGNIGIGTTNPNTKLHAVVSLTGGMPDPSYAICSETNGIGGIQILTNNTNSGRVVFADPESPSIGQLQYDHLDNSMRIFTNGSEQMRINDDGNVGIGTTSPGNDYKLAVEGKIGARSFKVTTASWADYVFAPTYELMPLSQVETYIQQNQHLPNVPSAQEVEENGFELETMDAKLMEKIEELTLYAIAQEKNSKQQSALLEEYMEKIKKLEKELNTLKKSSH